MEPSTQGTGNDSEPNALWSVLFTSSQEQNAPPFESEPQQQLQPPEVQNKHILLEESRECADGPLVPEGPSLKEPDMPCPTKTVADHPAASEQPTDTDMVTCAAEAGPKDDHARATSPSRDFVLPLAMETELQPQLTGPQSINGDASVAAENVEAAAPGPPSLGCAARNKIAAQGVEREEPQPPPPSVLQSLQTESLALDLSFSAPPQSTNPLNLEFSAPSEPTNPESDGVCTAAVAAAARPASPTVSGMTGIAATAVTDGEKTDATATGKAITPAPATDMEVDECVGEPAAAIATPAPQDQRSLEEISLEDDLEDADADPITATVMAAGEQADREDGNGGGGGRRLKRLRHAPTPLPLAAAAAPTPLPDPSSGPRQRKVDEAGLDNMTSAGGTDAAAAAVVGGGEGRPSKALRKRVVVRSAVGDEFEDLAPASTKDGGNVEGVAGDGATAGGARDAAGAGSAGDEEDGAEDEGNGEEDGDGAAGAGPAEDPEVAKQRLLREAALRDRIGGRAVADAPVRPLTDVLSRIMARQKSLVERTRANAPVQDAPPPPPPPAAAAPSAPPTFNVRALMQSLAQSKQQQPRPPPQQQQPQGGESTAGAVATAVSQPPAATVGVPTAAAADAQPSRAPGTEVPSSLETSSQLGLDLQLHGSEAAVPGLELQMSQVAAGTAAQSQQVAGEVRDVDMAEAAGGDGDGELLVVEEEGPLPVARSPFGAIRGLRPLDVAAAAAAAAATGAQRGQTFLVYEGSQPGTQQDQMLVSEDFQKQGPKPPPHQAHGQGDASVGLAGGGQSRGGSATLVKLIDLAHRAPSLPIRSESGSLVAGADGGSQQGAAGQDLGLVDVDLDLGEEDDLIVEPDPEPARVKDAELAKQEQQQQVAAGGAEGATGRTEEGKEGSPNKAADGEGEGEEVADEEEEEDLDDSEAEGEEEAGEADADAEEEEEAEGEEEGAAGEAAEGDDAEAEEEEEADDEAGEEGLVYDVDEEFDSTDEEDAVEPEALHFEEEEAATAAGAGLQDGTAAAGDTQPGSDAPGDPAAQKRRQQLTDVLIEAARQRRAAQLAEARRRAASEKGAGAYFVDVEAELSDEEEGIAALDDLEDEYDGEDLDEGMLASLLGTARESVVDEARRVELHAMWEAERDSAAVKELLEAVRRGFRRKRRNGLGGLDDDEDLNDHDARRRRAQLFASTVEDDDDAPIKVARGHGLDLDLARDDEDDDIDALPPPPESGSGSGTQDTGSQNPKGVAGGGRALPPPAARASARFPLGRGVAAGSGGGSGGISRILDPVEAKRLLRQQSQEAAAPASGRRQDGGAGGTSPRDSLDPSPPRSAAAAAARHSDDVVALLQRSASASAGLMAGAPGPAGEPGAGVAAGGGGGPAGHRFALFGSDITNRAGAGGAPAERLQVGAGASTFLGRSTAPTSLRTTSNAAAGVNTRSFVFGADASNSGFPEKSRDAAVAAAVDVGGGGSGAGVGAAAAAAAPSFAALRSVIAQQPSKDARRGGGGSGGSGLMGLLGLSTGGGTGGGGGSGADGRGSGSSSMDLKRKLVSGDVTANKRRV